MFAPATVSRLASSLFLQRRFGKIYILVTEIIGPALATRYLLSFFILSSTLLWGVEVRNNYTFLSHPNFHTSQRCRSVEKSEKVKIMSPFSLRHDPSVILYLVLHFSEVWKCGIVWQSKDNVTLFPWSRTLCYSLLSSTLLRGVEVEKKDKAFMTGGKCATISLLCRTIPHFHTSEKCGTK